MTKSLVLAAGVFALAAISFSTPALANGSCSQWKNTCVARSANGPALCNSKFAQCKRDGCWTEGGKSRGATHCGLRKS